MKTLILISIMCLNLIACEKYFNQDNLKPTAIPKPINNIPSGNTPDGLPKNGSNILKADNPTLPVEGTPQRVNPVPEVNPLSFVKDRLLEVSTGLHETGQEWQFLLAPNKDLYAIVKSNSFSHKTEVHVLSAASKYKDFILQVPTALPELGSEWQFLLSPNLDLYAIAKKNTVSHKTEVYVLSAASKYTEIIQHTPTALHETGDEWQFLLAENLDLFAIVKKGSATNKTEVHVLSAASQYSEYNQQTPTPIGESFDIFDFALDWNRDLIAIQKKQTGTHSTEIHILSAASNYQNFILQTGTSLSESGNQFAFLAGYNTYVQRHGSRGDESYTVEHSMSDLYAILKSGTGSGNTEVHVFSLKGSEYFHQAIDIDFAEISQKSSKPIVFLINGFGGCNPCITPDLQFNLNKIHIPAYNLDWNDIYRRDALGNLLNGELNDAYLTHQMLNEVFPKIPTDRKIVIIGHSFGGDSALKIADKSGRDIELLVTLDAVEGKGNFINSITSGNLGGVGRRTTYPVTNKAHSFYNRWTTNPAVKGLLPVPIPLNFTDSGLRNGYNGKDSDQQVYNIARHWGTGEPFEVRCPWHDPTCWGTFSQRITHGATTGSVPIYNDEFIQSQLYVRIRDIMEKSEKLNAR